MVIRHNRQVVKTGIHDSIGFNLVGIPAVRAAEDEDASRLDGLDVADAFKEFYAIIDRCINTYRSLKLRAASENWSWQGLFRRI
jgi:hypothetical protein